MLLSDINSHFAVTLNRCMKDKSSSIFIKRSSLLELFIYEGFHKVEYSDREKVHQSLLKWSSLPKMNF